jgi:hypothetical protein
MKNVEKFHALGGIRSLDREGTVPLTSLSLHVGLYVNIGIKTEPRNKENNHFKSATTFSFQIRVWFLYAVIFLSYSTLRNIRNLLPVSRRSFQIS